MGVEIAAAGVTCSPDSKEKSLEVAWSTCSGGDVEKGGKYDQKWLSSSSCSSSSSCYKRKGDDEEDDGFVSRLQRHNRSLLAGMSASLASLAVGTVIGFTSPAIPAMLSEGPYPNEAQISWIASLVSLGAVIGNSLGGVFLDRYGRKTVLMLLGLPFVIGWLLIGATHDVYLIYAGRFLTGICMGFAGIGVPVYTAEIASTDLRGLMGSFHELATNYGLMFVFGLGCVLRWQWLSIACGFVPVFMVALMFFMPESPRWLLAKGRREETIEALVWLRGEDVDIMQELAEIEENVRSSGNEPISLVELAQPNLYKPLCIIAGLMFFQQFSGYGIVPEYMVSILASAGSSWDPFSQTALIGAVGVVANLLSALVVDRAGRRVMLMISAIVMFLSIGIISSYFTIVYFRPDVDLTFLCYLPTISLMGFNFGVALGYGPVPFYLASELFPMRARGIVGGIGISLLWVFSFITSFSFPHMTTFMPEYIVYWILTGFTAIGILFAYFAVPETKGKSLEEIEMQFKKK